MKISRLCTAVILATCLFFSTVQAEKMYILFDPACMDRVEYTHDRPEGRVDYYAYHVNVKTGEKLILETGPESSNQQNYLPTPYVGCNNGSFDQSLLKRINGNIDEVFVVYPKNDRTFVLAPVVTAAYYLKNGSVITYDSPKYRFRFDLNNGEVGQNIALDNLGSKVYFEGFINNDCKGAYAFRQLSPQSAFPLIDVVLVPEFGIVEERSGANPAAAESNRIYIDQVNGQNFGNYLRSICGNEPGSRSSILGSVANTTTSPTAYDAPIIYGTTNPSSPYLLDPPTSTVAARGPVTPVAGSPGPSGATHTVQKGETLYAIAKRYNVTVDQIRSWNNLQGNTILTGQTLSVQSPAMSGDVAYKGSTPVQTFPPPYETNAQIPYTGGQQSVAAPSAAAAAANEKIHIVSSGETVASIAQKYGYLEDKFRQINGLGAREFIKVGQRLRISDCNCPDTSNAATVGQPTPTTSEFGASPGRVKPTEFATQMPQTPSVYDQQQPNTAATSPNTGQVTRTIIVPSGNPLSDVQARTPVNSGSTTAPAYDPNLAITNDTRFGVVAPRGYDYPQTYNPPQNTSPTSGSNISSLEGMRSMSPSGGYDYPAGGGTYTNPYPANTTSAYPATTTPNYGTSGSYATDPYNSGAYTPGGSVPLGGQPSSYETPITGYSGGAPAGSNVNRRVHIVQEGESLYGIARRYNLNLDTLRYINQLEPTEVILPGQSLYLE